MICEVCRNFYQNIHEKIPDLIDEAGNWHGEETDEAYARYDRAVNEVASDLDKPCLVIDRPNIESNMTFDNYQRETEKTATYPDMGSFGGLVYCTLGLTGEAGEAAEKVKKTLRDAGGVLSEEKKQELIKELGDVLWYLARMGIEMNVSLSEIAAANLEKLRSRKERGVIQGSGDNR